MQRVNAVSPSARGHSAEPLGLSGPEPRTCWASRCRGHEGCHPLWDRDAYSACVRVCSRGPASRHTGSVLGGPALMQLGDGREPTSGFPSRSRGACHPHVFRGASCDRAGWSTAGPPGPPLADRGGQVPKRTQRPPCPQPAPAPGALAGWGAPEWIPSGLWLCPHAHPAGRSGVSCPGGAPNGVIPGFLRVAFRKRARQNMIYLFSQRITFDHEVSSFFNFLVNIYFSMNSSYTKANRAGGTRKYDGK